MVEAGSVNDVAEDADAGNECTEARADDKTDWDASEEDTRGVSGARAVAESFTLCCISCSAGCMTSAAMSAGGAGNAAAVDHQSRDAAAGAPVAAADDDKDGDDDDEDKGSLESVDVHASLSPRTGCSDDGR